MRKRIAAGIAALGLVLTGLVASPAQAEMVPIKAPLAAVEDNPVKGKDGQLKYAPPTRTKDGAQSRALAAIQPGDDYRYYNTAWQFTPAGTKGVNAGFTIVNTYKAPQEYHTLEEIAVQTADQQQTVEIIWGKGLWCGQLTQPCLSGFHWVDKVPSCYPNGTTGSCGWTDYASSLDLKDPLPNSPVGCSFRAGIRENDTTKDMMLWATPCFGTQPIQWIGHFDRDLWASSSNPNWTIGLTQIYSEIASKYDPVNNPALDGYPCTDAGNGYTGKTTNGPYPSSGSRIGDIEFAGLPKTAVNVAIESTAPDEFEPVNAAAYDIKYIEGIADSPAGNRRYVNLGGPGFAAANGSTAAGIPNGC